MVWKLLDEAKVEFFKVTRGENTDIKPIGPVNALYPMPTTLVGTTVNGKPNFLTVAHVGILNHGTSQYFSIGLGKIYYSNDGIFKNYTFSICLPSEDIVIQTDNCGIKSEKKTDKTVLFDVFYGELKTVPMFGQCHVNMELKLNDVLGFPKHDIFIGELIQTYADESVLTEDRIDIDKLKTLLFDIASKKYRSIGSIIGACWSIGKSLKETS